jgi:hypothetical protein
MQNHHQNSNNNLNNPLQLKSEQVDEKQVQIPTGRVFNIGGIQIVEYMPEGFNLCPFCTCCTSTDICGNCGKYIF